MTAVELGALKDKDFRLMTVDELKSVKRQAGDAYRTAGESERFNEVFDFGGQRYSINTLERTEKKAQVWIDIKEGR